MGETSPRAMTPQDLTRIPRGERSADRAGWPARGPLSSPTLSAERDEYLSNIWLVSADGGEPTRRFTTGPGRDVRPRLVARWDAPGLCQLAAAGAKAAGVRHACRWWRTRMPDRCRQWRR